MNLNYLAPINSLGYGTVGYNLLIALSSEFDVAAWPIGRQVNYPVPEGYCQQTVQKALNNQATFDKNAPCLRLWHQFDMAEMVGKGLHIGFPIFELDRFNPRELHHLNSLDEIFVCSEWAQQILLKELPLRKRNNIHVIPLGVDRSIFYDEPMPKSGPTIFLNVGKWEVRKGHDVLIDAFEQAFDPTDDVELWMMNHNPFLSKEAELEWHRLYKNNPMGSKVKLLPRVETQQELANVMRQAHCGVFPARAEGWNLEALEMMSCGRHVITTDYAAHKDFCTTDNSFLVSVTELEDAWDGIWFNGEGQWAKVDVDKVADHMRFVYDLRKGRMMMPFNDAGVETAKRLTWENSAATIRQTIEARTPPSLDMGIQLVL